MALDHLPHHRRAGPGQPGWSPRNPHYWDRERGPRVQEIIFRNDLSPSEALELICNGEGEVDILTEAPPSDAARIEASDHAGLVSIDAIRTVAGVINRDAEGLPLGDRRARLALNLAIDREALIAKAMFGYAKATFGLTPPAGILSLDRVLHPFSAPYAHDPGQAADLWQAAGAGQSRPLRISALRHLEPVARHVAADLERALGIRVEVSILREHEAELQARRQLAEKRCPLDWDILILQQTPQAAESVATEVHRAFIGADGEYRAGPILPEFEALYATLFVATSPLIQTEITHQLDRFVHDEALALFLCAPSALYAVNKHVRFTPYRTTFELASTHVTDKHWSRQSP